ncbi:hypothetical protein GGR58DRAFT_462510 [Xylaria digitata]|nr:hypothetical protein GGR58DRAFT_462510 [Xylaria digitata]
MFDYLRPRRYSGSTDSHEPLLDEKDEAQRPNEGFLQRWKPLTLRIALLIYVLCSSISLVVLGWNYNEKPYSPVNHVLSYERKALYFGENPKFTGLPEEVDEAWDYLLEPINIRLTHHELEQSRATFADEIVQLTDGDYVSVLSVHHELHCLDALRRNIYYSYYYPNATEEERRYSIIHMSHCVDTIRRSLMCKADIAVYTAYWIGIMMPFRTRSYGLIQIGYVSIGVRLMLGQEQDCCPRTSTKSNRVLLRGS